MHWLADTTDAMERRHIKRFDPRFWTVNFPRPMMAAAVTTGHDALSVRLVFYKDDDLAGLIWASEDTIDHPLLAYATDRDYRGVRLSFQWLSTNVRPLNAVNGPTLTIEGRDAGGAPRTWFVRLWNYAQGSPEDAVITLDFDALDGGFLLPQEADPVWAGDIDRLFISLIPPGFDPTSSAPIGDGMGGFQHVEATLALSAIKATGGRSSVPIGDDYVRPHGLRLANGYDDVFNVTPERLIRNALRLGYRDWLNHYVGMSHYYTMSWSAGEGRFVIDPAAPALNAATALWHQDLFARAAALELRVVVSLSFELFEADAPQDWRQRTFDGSPALTGWVPPSTLIAPTNTDALAYLRDVFLAFGALATAAGLAPVFQLGEPWWWHQLSGQQSPCFYDATTTALYTAETGQSVPTAHHSIAETPDAAQQAYLDWLGAKLGAATLWLRDQVKAAHPGADVALLFFTPQVLNPAAPMLQTVNLPAASWTFPAFDILQVEDYDHVVAGDWAAHAAGLAAVAQTLGYGPADSHYFAGFSLLPDQPGVWANIDRAADDGVARGFAETFVWAYPQVVRDGFVYHQLQEDGVTGFHDVRFPTHIAFGSSGGPRFSTDVVETASGFEHRNVNWSQARADYDVGSGIRSEDDLGEVLAFFRARAGRAYAFRFKDWADHRSGAPSAAVAPTDQALGTGDGAATTFALTKTYVSGTQTHVRRIHKPVAGTVRVALDGVEQGAGWTLDADHGTVTFDVAPAAGVAVTAGFEFDVPVRFADDALAISLDSFRAGQAPGIGLIEVRLGDGPGA